MRIFPKVSLFVEVPSFVPITSCLLPCLDLNLLAMHLQPEAKHEAEKAKRCSKGCCLLAV
jgi:hypothetical protein